MDHELIYAKTASGERAMLERTRTMPRNVRMVLILVDSRSSVADLCLKTGNPQMTESALRELEIGGFIEPYRHKDSLWDEEEKLAREIRASASNKKAKDRTTRTAPKSASSVSGLSDTGTSALTTESSAAPERLEAHVEARSAAVPAVPTQAQGASAQATESPSSIGQRFKELFSKPPGAARSEPGFVPPTSQRSSAPHETGVLLKRKTRSPARRGALAALMLLIALTALAVTAALFPFARYLPELEAAMTSACKRPVRIAKLGVEFSPKPVLKLGDVRIGDGDAALRLAELHLEPTPGSLLAARVAFGSAVVRGVSLSAETLIKLPALFSDLAQAGALKAMERLDIENATLSLGGVDLPAMRGTIGIDAGSQFGALRVASADKVLTLALTPRLEAAKATGLDVIAEAVGWRPAEGTPWLVDTLSAEGQYANGVLSISRFEIRVFDGVITGAAVLGSDTAKHVSGELMFKHLNTARLSDVLGFAQRLVGDMDGRMNFSMQGDGAAFDADGEFSIGRGTVRGIDLSEAARRLARTPVLGGETKFENLSGKLRLTPGASRVSEIVLNSGLMQSTGSIEVGKDLALSGRLELRTQGTANQTRIPLVVAGTLHTPSVQVVRSE